MRGAALTLGGLGLLAACGAATVGGSTQQQTSTAFIAVQAAQHGPGQTAPTPTTGPPGPGPGGPATVGGWALPLPRSALTEQMLAKPHHDYPGQDLGAPIGTPIYAVQGGQVVKAGAVGGYGNHYVEIQVTTSSGTCMLWWYGHGSAHYVQTGQTVRGGHLIALVGNEGYSTGPHLHLGLRRCGVGLDRAEYRCPQGVTLAIWRSQPVPDPASMPYDGCEGPPL